MADLIKVDSWIEEKTPDFFKVLPKHVEPEAFKRIVLNALGSNKLLLECTPISLYNSFMTCAELGLMPSTVLGHCFVIPYNEKQKNGSYAKVAHFQFGYKGKVELARRSGEIGSIDAHPVYKQDEFGIEFGTQGFIKHKPNYQQQRTSDNLTGVYAIVYYSNKDIPCVYDFMPKEEIEKRRLVSKTKDDFAWTKWYAEMAIGKLLGKMFGYMPLSPELKLQLAKEDDYEADFEDMKTDRNPVSVAALELTS